MRKQITAIDAIKRGDDFMGKADGNIFAAAYNYRRARELYTGGKFADFVRRESARPYDTVRGLAYAGLLIDYTGGKYAPAADFAGMNVSALKTVFKRACGKFMPADEARKACAAWLKDNGLTVKSSVHAIEAAGKDTGKAAGKDTGADTGADTGNDDAGEQFARAEKAAITRDFNEACKLIAAGDCTGKELETLLAVMTSCFDAVKTGRKYEAGGKLKALKETRKAAGKVAAKKAADDAKKAAKKAADDAKKAAKKAADDAAELARIEASTAGHSVKHVPAAGDGAAAKAYSRALAADKAIAAGK